MCVVGLCWHLLFEIFAAFFLRRCSYPRALIIHTKKQMLTMFDLYVDGLYPPPRHACSPGVWCGRSVDHMHTIPPKQQLVCAHDRVYCCAAHADRQTEETQCVVCIHDGPNGYHFMVAHMTPMRQVYEIVESNRPTHEDAPFVLCLDDRPLDVEAVVTSDTHLALRVERMFP